MRMLLKCKNTVASKNCGSALKTNAMDYEVLIEKYLKGTLNEKEQAEFNTLRGTDKAFNEEVIFHENLRDVLSAENDPVRTMVEEFESENTSESSRTEPWKHLLVAASFFAILGLAIYFNLTRPVSSSDLYNVYYENFPNVVNPTVRGAEIDAADAAFEAYENGRFEEALARFSELHATEGTDYYLFYMANSQMELERSDEAIELLQEFEKTKDSMADKAGWYKALAYLQKDDQEKAKAELKKVIEDKAYNANKAEELLAELE